MKQIPSGEVISVVFLDTMVMGIPNNVDIDDDPVMALLIRMKDLIAKPPRDNQIKGLVFPDYLDNLMLDNDGILDNIEAQNYRWVIYTKVR